MTAPWPCQRPVLPYEPSSDEITPNPATTSWLSVSSGRRCCGAPLQSRLTGKRSCPPRRTLQSCPIPGAGFKKVSLVCPHHSSHPLTRKVPFDTSLNTRRVRRPGSTSAASGASAGCEPSDTRARHRHWQSRTHDIMKYASMPGYQPHRRRLPYATVTSRLPTANCRLGGYRGWRSASRPVTTHSYRP